MPRRKVHVKKEIIDALKRERALTWSQLIKHTRVSPGGLSPHLKELIEWNMLKTEVDIKTRPATTYYKLTKKGRRRLKLWVHQWDQEMQKMQEFLDLILKLTLDEKQKLHDLMEKYIRLERLEQLDQDRKYDIIDEKDKIVLRERKTGKTLDFILFGNG
ncbi:transcriptional regulator [Candidatus Bathyarchaeota archaeon]|nr:transcriptional regulator [Candidatus Bathyarchaeota archaeon]